MSEAALPNRNRVSYSFAVHRDRRHPRPRLRIGRLIVVIIASLLGSAAVATASSIVLPPKEPVMMADPLLGAATLYEARLPNTRADRDSGRAFWPGEQPPKPPGPIAGLSQKQTTVAWYVVETGKQMQLPKRAYIIAIMTALQETNLRNLANPKVPASLKLPNDGTGTNYDSIGVFQQRPSMGWGTVAQLMDPSQSAARFYARLNKVTGWQSLSLGGAAQAVQRSAYPSAYTKHEALATSIVNTLTRTSTS